MESNASSSPHGTRIPGLTGRHTMYRLINLAFASTRWASWKERSPLAAVLALCIATEGCHLGTGRSRQAVQQRQPYPTLEGSWTNTLGMMFVPVRGTKVLFSVWDTRVQDFQEFVQASGYDASAFMVSLRNDGWMQRGDSWKNPGFSQGPMHPVCGVSWEDAKAFCAWLTRKEQAEGKIGPEQTYRLPMDGEWSVAVGLDESVGGTPKDKDAKVLGVYPWGTQWPPPDGAGNYAGAEARTADTPSSWSVIPRYRDGYPRTSPVGSFEVNRFGLFDVGANLMEWCEDQDRGDRVLRGASWGCFDLRRGFESSRLLLSSHRSFGSPDHRHDICGFRCVLVVGGSARGDLKF
jgi:formylglycine-generating enzyme required for sulfatase activity